MSGDRSVSLEDQPEPKFELATLLFGRILPKVALFGSRLSDGSRSSD